jgi:hypothetical protein
MMSTVLHITSGDIAGKSLVASGVQGEVFVWHDILYDGPRLPGWPDDKTLDARAVFLEKTTAGGLDSRSVLKTLHDQYRKLAEAAANRHLVLWFDACLFDQAMLAHILTCLLHLGAKEIELLCVDSFPGIDPFHGLGQLQPDQLASLYGHRLPVTDAQIRFAVRVDEAFASQDIGLLAGLSHATHAPLPWIPKAVARWLQERPDPVTGLGLLEDLALKAIRAGCETPDAIFKYVAAADTPPQFWGDITLWAKINALAEREPPLLKIDGPKDRLPQWQSGVSLSDFRIKALPNQPFHATADSRA